MLGLSRSQLIDSAFSLQSRAYEWMETVWPNEAIEAIKDKPTLLSGVVRKRFLRFGEEAIELLQTQLSEATVINIVKYVYRRKRGKAKQEVGGVLITLSILCEYLGFSMNQCGEDEMARIVTKIDEIRAKDAAKPIFAVDSVFDPLYELANEIDDITVTHDTEKDNQIECNIIGDCLRGHSINGRRSRLYIPGPDLTLQFNCGILVESMPDGLKVIINSKTKDILQDILQPPEPIPASVMNLHKALELLTALKTIYIPTGDSTYEIVENFVDTAYAETPKIT